MFCCQFLSPKLSCDRSEWKLLSGWQVTGVPSACVWCGYQTISHGLFGRGKSGHSVNWVLNIAHVFSCSPLPCAVGRVCPLPMERHPYTQGEMDGLRKGEATGKLGIWGTGWLSEGDRGIKHKSKSSLSRRVNMSLLVCCFVFWERVLLCSPGWPCPLYLPVSTLWVTSPT